MPPPLPHGVLLCVCPAAPSQGLHSTQQPWLRAKDTSAFLSWSGVRRLCSCLLLCSGWLSYLGCPCPSITLPIFLNSSTGPATMIASRLPANLLHSVICDAEWGLPEPRSALPVAPLWVLPKAQNADSQAWRVRRDTVIPSDSCSNPPLSSRVSSPWQEHFTLAVLIWFQFTVFPIFT